MIVVALFTIGGLKSVTKPVFERKTIMTTELTPEERTAARAQEHGKKVIRTLLLVALAFLIAAIALPSFWYETWTGSPDIWTGVLKTVELALIVAFVGCLIGIGGVKITSSEAGHMEWLGTALVAVFAAIGGVALFLKATTTDEFADYHNLVAQRSARALAAKPEVEYDFEKGILNYKIEEHFLWIVVNVDYVEGHPLPRESHLFYTFKPAETGFAKFEVREDDRPHVRRVAVFYGTGNGPSSEGWVLKKEPPVIPTITLPASPASPATPTTFTAL